MASDDLYSASFHTGYATMPFKLFELPTEAVDNSVGNRFANVLTDGFYYSFVNLNNLKTIIIFILISMS